MKGDKTPYVEAKISGMGRKVENSVGVNILKIRKIFKRRRKYVIKFFCLIIRIANHGSTQFQVSLLRS